MRPLIRILSVLLLVAGIIPGVTQEKSVYPIAVWYGGGKARAPMQESDARANRNAWKKDLDQIRELGFPAVKTWVEWASSERTEGKYDLDNLEQLLELADEAGMRVIIQVYVDSAPDWVGERFSDSRFVAQNGDAIPSQAAPGFCTDHPEVAKRVASFYGAIAKVAAKHRSFYAYDLWSEPHIINWAIINYIPDAQFCFCKYTIAKFRAWLEHKYGTLENLNKAWYRGFERWGQVEPPRFGTILSYSDFIDWKNFIADKLADDLRDRRAAVKSVDDRHPATSHAAVPCIFTSPFGGDGTPDDWKMAGAADFYGTSIYPKHSSSAAPWSTLRRAGALDFIRSSGMKNNGFYIGELQAGFGTTGVRVGEPVTSEDLEDWIWGATARGARSISIYAYYPMSSGYESGGYGLVELDGTLTQRSRRAGSTAAILNRHADFFLKARPAAAEAAILYNPAAHLVGGEQSGGIRGGVRDSLFGYYRTFFDHNVPVDFVHVLDLENGKWGRYKLLIVPYSIMLSSKAAQEIDRFVAGGGHVLAEARTAWNDERGWAASIIPGSGLHETFGCREREVRPRTKTVMRVTALPGPNAGPETSAYMEIGGAIYEEVLQLAGSSSRAIGSFQDGSPAVVLNQRGKGATIFVGSFPGLAHEAQPSSGFDQFMSSILRWSGIAAPVVARSTSGKEVPEIRMMEAGAGRLIIVFNREATEERLEIEFPTSPLPQSARSWTEGTPVTLTRDSRVLKVTVPAGRVSAIFLE